MALCALGSDSCPTACPAADLALLLSQCPLGGVAPPSINPDISARRALPDGHPGQPNAKASAGLDTRALAHVRHRTPDTMNTDTGRGAGLLDAIERVGNRLPDPTTLFALGTLLVMALSHLAWSLDWSVTERLPQQVTRTVTDAAGQPVVDERTGEARQEPVLDPRTGEPQVQWRTVYRSETVPVTEPVLDASGAPVADPASGEVLMQPALDPATGEALTREVETGEPVVHRARSLLTSDGLFHALSSLVANFMAFPPLGVVLVGMLGIGVAERTGLIGAALRAVMLVMPAKLLTPSVVFIGIMSSLATDAGYVVLPPLAAALYYAVGRPPLAGLAAVFAGVSAGFAANLFITGLDPMLAEFTQLGARVIHAGYAVNPAANWWFMIVSTVVITLSGWAITSWFVERRLRAKPADEGGPPADGAGDLAQHRLNDEEKRAMRAAGIALVLTLGAFALMILWRGGPLHGEGTMFARWVEVIVPMILFVFVIPGIVYGWRIGKLRRDRDVADLLQETMAAMAPFIVLAFFAAQFIAFFQHSGLDRMLAMAGGQWLGQIGLGAGPLMLAFILVTVVFNLFIGSMSAKYAMFAPIFVPMFMMVGVSPELSQAAYRIGDSVSNVITPLNPYLVIVLVFMQKYVPRGGIGTLIAIMFPYTVGFLVVWSVLLLAWMALGVPLGPDGGLSYAIGG
jgi:aminobenzoyl-glutamate transport protein